MKIIHYKFPKTAIRIEAGLAGELTADNILIRTFAAQLEADGSNISKVDFPDREERTFDHPFDDLQVM